MCAYRSRTILALISSLAHVCFGVREDRPSRDESSVGTFPTQAKIIAGVPVLNYKVYGGPSERSALGKASSGELDDETQNWVLMLKPGSDDLFANMCGELNGSCDFIGSSKMLPCARVSGTLADLKNMFEKAQGAVIYAEQDVFLKAIPVTGNTGNTEDSVRQSELWPDYPMWGLKRIGRDSRGNVTGAGTNVYVFDTGIRFTHQEFEGRAVPAVEWKERSGQELLPCRGGQECEETVECSGDMTCAVDKKGHGTHCAGTAVGKTVGVAPGARVWAVKVLDRAGYTTLSRFIRSIMWVTEKRYSPAIGSMSLGGGGRYQSEREAIDYAVNQGLTIVVAAGNEDHNACSFTPAWIPSTISVGAVKEAQTRTTRWSNFGRCVDIWAPGQGIWSAVAKWDDYTYENWDGTSMACPHVAGAAALVLELKPSSTPAEVRGNLTRHGLKNEIAGLIEQDNDVLLNIRDGWDFSPPPPSPAPVPTPAPQDGTWEIVDGRGCTKKGQCIKTKKRRRGKGNYPDQYPPLSWCVIEIYGMMDLTVESFSTEEGWDYLNIGGDDYSGQNAPPSGVYNGTIHWAADQDIQQSGWVICRTD